MECYQVQEKLSAFMDGALDEATLEAVEAHLDHCEECREELEALRVVVDLTSGILEVDPPPFLSSAIKDAVAREREAEESCAEYVTMLSAYVDGELSTKEREELESHVGQCQVCAKELLVLRSTVASMNLVREVAPPTTLRGRIAAATTGRKRFAPIETLKRRVEALSIPRFGWAAGITAAAACVVGIVLATSHQPSAPTKVAVKTDRPAPIVAEAPKLAATPEVKPSPSPVQPETRRVVVHHRRIVLAAVPRANNEAKVAVTLKRVATAPKVNNAKAQPVASVASVPKDMVYKNTVDEKSETFFEDKSSTETSVQIAEAPKSTVMKLSLSAVVSAKDVDQYFKDIKLDIRMNQRSSDGIRVDVISKRF